MERNGTCLVREGVLGAYLLRDSDGHLSTDVKAREL